MIISVAGNPAGGSPTRKLAINSIDEIYWAMENPEEGRSAFLDLGTDEGFYTIPEDLTGAGNEAEEENPRDEDRNQIYAWRYGEFDEADQAEARFIYANEKERFLAIPEAKPWWGYSDLEAFVETESDPRLQSRLAAAIRGKGAFRRFKTIIAKDPLKREEWKSFQSARQEERVREWLEGEGVELIILQESLEK